MEESMNRIAALFTIIVFTGMIVVALWIVFAPLMEHACRAYGANALFPLK
jgi:hypothetical protein